MPEAAAVATAAEDGAPSVRMVLVKQADENGFVFYTNYESRKARELAANPAAALLFYWDPLGRQVRIEGAVAAHHRRGVGGLRPQPGAREPAERAVVPAEPADREPGSAGGPGGRAGRSPRRAAICPLPEAWGGFRLTPHTFEFWQNRNDRLHDRLVYRRRPEGGWAIERLAP